MKLNKKRTLLIAFAFFAILMLWQVYYYYVPLFLNTMLLDRFGGVSGDYDNIIGHIMSLDSLAAILVIPLFGWLSDRTKSRIGRRMPYIVCGSLLSLILFPLIAVMYLFDQFVWYFVIVILLVISMATFRSPAVSLMPDVTPKPLRTNGNAIINFVGYIGAIIGSGLTLLFAFNQDNPDKISTIFPFVITSVILMAVIVIFLLRFYENRVVRQVAPEIAEGERLSQTIEAVTDGKPLSKRDKINFGIIISAVFFCWFAFNALQNFGSLYAERILDAEDEWGMCTIALAVCSLVAFLPSIWLSKKIGRKWSVIVGLSVVLGALVTAAVLNFDSFNFLIVAIFGISGLGWAVVMVNSYPMFVEMSTSKNVGRITGIYYFVSQGAMFLTSNVSGYVYKFVGLDFYYYYAIIFMSIALVICFFFKTQKKSLV